MSNQVIPSLQVRVYYEDTDAAGIVYHANYLRYAERARSDMMRYLGFDNATMARERHLGFAIRHATLDYRRPARLDDLLTVETRLISLGGASSEVEQNILGPDGTVLVVIQLTAVCIDLRTGAAQRMPADMRAALEPYCAILEKA